MGYLQIPVVHDATKTTWSCACKSNTNLAIINGNWDRVFFTVQKISNIPNYNRPSTYNTSLQSWCILQLSVEDSKIKHTVRSNYDVLYQWAYHFSYKHATLLNIITNPVYCTTQWGYHKLRKLWIKRTRQIYRTMNNDQVLKFTSRKEIASILNQLAPWPEKQDPAPE